MLDAVFVEMCVLDSHELLGALELPLLNGQDSTGKHRQIVVVGDTRLLEFPCPFFLPQAHDHE